jgi:tRNA dimethylallyltransferase
MKDERKTKDGDKPGKDELTDAQNHFSSSFILHPSSLIPVVVGPTCSGKSDLGIALAQRFNGEIINLDSIQVYRRLNVGTAKVPLDERCGIPHHLIDVADPTENYTAGRYAREAGALLADIESRGKTAIFVGGTGLYLNALRGRIFDEESPTDLRLRERLKALRDRRGAAWLHRMLKRLDPVSAERLQPNDWSRTTRALEFLFHTKTRISEHRPKLPPPPEFAARMRIIVLNPPREALYDKINRRVDVMERAGLLAEIEGLIADGVPMDAKAFEAHGYKRVVEYLRGNRTYESAIEQMKTDTRHYAKRQWSWWRGEPEAVWFDGFGGDPEVQASVIRFFE